MTLQTFDPRILLGDRFGILFYVYLVNLYLKGEKEKLSRLYEQFISAFPGEKKEHKSETFIALIESIQQNGYDPHFPVVANPYDYLLVEGAHRCGIAIALGIEQIPYSLTFQNNGATKDKIKQILPKETLAEIEMFRTHLLTQFPKSLRQLVEVREVVRQNEADFRQAPFSSQTLYPTTRTYQATQNISGKRATEMRWQAYRLYDYLKHTDRVLEIGCNVGFLTAQLAQCAQEVDAYDINQSFIKVAKVYNDHTNVQFHAVPFEAIPTEKRYDFIVACAVHGWVSSSFWVFYEKLISMLEEGGLVLMESHEILFEKNWPLKAEFLKETSEILHRGLIDDVDHRLYASEIREFLVIRPKQDPGTLRNIIASYQEIDPDFSSNQKNSRTLLDRARRFLARLIK